MKISYDNGKPDLEADSHELFVARIMTAAFCLPYDDHASQKIMYEAALNFFDSRDPCDSQSAERISRCQTYADALYESLFEGANNQKNPWLLTEDAFRAIGDFNSAKITGRLRAIDEEHGIDSVEYLIRQEDVW